MGADRALIVALQALLMSGVRDYRIMPAVGAMEHRLLATAASLDYVLMLATGTAGTRIAPDDARRAIHDGLVRAVDDALGLMAAVAAGDARGARSFSRGALRTLRAAIAAEALGDDRRMFALIVLANDLSV